MARDSIRRLDVRAGGLHARRQLVAVEQLVAAEHDDAGFDEPEAGADVAGDQPQPVRLARACRPPAPR